MGVTENPEGTRQAQVGASPSSAPSKSQFGGQVSPENVTQADVEAAIHKTKSEEGRKRAEERRVWQVKQNERELAGLQGNQEAYDSAKVRQESQRAEEAATNALAEAHDVEQRANDALANARKIESNAKAKELASQNTIDVNQLLSLSDGKIDKMEELAPILPKVNPATTDTPAVTPVITPTLNPDTNESAGGGSLSIETLVKKDTRVMNPTELAEHRKALSAKSKGLEMG